MPGVQVPAHHLAGVQRSRNDEWRLYGGVNRAPAHWNLIGGLIDAIGIWRRSRKKPD